MSNKSSDNSFERKVDPHDIMPIIGYLASETASDVTGSTLQVSSEEVGVLPKPGYVRLSYSGVGGSVN